MAGSRTPRPCATTSPAISWPSVTGRWAAPLRSRLRSVRQTPAARTRRTTSPGPGRGAGTSTSAVRPRASSRNAFIRVDYRLELNSVSTEAGHGMTTLDTVVRTQQGALRGRSANGVMAFKGVPYAAAPFGARRLKAPQRAERWDGVRNALAYGPTAPHAGYAPPYDVLLPDPVLPGEDCLNLNVWTAEPGAAGLPVMVWIHGGAFVNGSGAVPTYDGSAFARHGVVLVTINYRLGAEGFLWLEDGINNRGLLDQLAALEWVQENIAAFGGDIDNVTVFGESAGAMSIGALLATERSDGLFRRAILQSGAGHHAITPATARLVAAAVGGRLGVEPTAAALAAVSVDE